MGAWGGIIMGFFGAVFAVLTLVLGANVHGAALALPFLVFAAIAFAARRVLGLPGIGLAPSARESRVIMWSSIGEGAGMFVAGNVLANIGRTDLTLPAIALVVGLHFLPIAWATRLRAFWVLGATLIAAAAIGLVLGTPPAATFAGILAALALWTAAILAIARDRQARLRSA